MDGLAEAAQALPLADAGGPGDAGQGEGAVVVLLDEGEHPLDALLVLVGAGAAGREVGRKAPAQGHAQRRQFGPHHELVARVLGGQGVAGVHQGLDGPGLGLPVKGIGPEGPAPRQGGDVLFGKDGVLAAGDEPGAEHRRPYLAAGGGVGAVQHPGVDGDAAALDQMVGGVGGLHRQLARQDVDGLELVVPVPGQRVVGVGGVALGVARAGEIQGALGFELPPLGREVERRVDAALVQAHGGLLVPGGPHLCAQIWAGDGFWSVYL